MPTFLVSRCLLRPLNLSRSFTTRPRRLPLHKSLWDPTRSTRIYPTFPVPVLAKEQDGPTLAESSFDQEVLRDVQRVQISCNATDDAIVRFATLRLNLCLRQADPSVSKEADVGNLWRAYQVAKRHVPDLPSKLPDRAWDILWDNLQRFSQAVTRQPRRARRRPLNILHQDMRAVGKYVTVGQTVTYLRKVFRSGKRKLALTEWEDQRIHSERWGRQGHKPEHLECGAEMYARVGHVERARDIMEELYYLYPKWSPSLRMVVFRAFTRSSSDAHRMMASDMYAQMKPIFGKPTLKFYDACLVGFLEAGDLHNGRVVFGDMVKDGLIAVDYSQREINLVLRRFDLLYRLGTDMLRATNIVLYVINVLPKSYHQHLFGVWLRTAVIKKAPTAASQIIELMFQRGYEPETFQFNLLLRALLRSKWKPDVLKAENMAWQMVDTLRRKGLPKVQHAHAAVAISHAAADISHTLSPEPDLPSSDPLPRKAPPANAATFALLMKHHANLEQWEHVDYLARKMKEMSLQPNEYVMNVLMHNQCSQGKYEKVWETYTSLTNVPEGTSGVFPNGATFRCLWKTLRLALRDLEVHGRSGLPSPRSLLAENVKWWNLVRSRYDADRFRMAMAAENHGAVTKLIVHCFSYTSDVPGSLVALHALRHRFDLFPSNQVAKVIQSQLAYMDMKRETGIHETGSSRHGVYNRKSQELAELYSMLIKARFERTNMTDEQFKKMTVEEQGDFALNTMSEFIRVMMKRLHPPEEVEALITKAKMEIGLPDMPTGDLDAFSTI